MASKESKQRADVSSKHGEGKPAEKSKPAGAEKDRATPPVQEAADRANPGAGGEAEATKLVEPIIDLEIQSMIAPPTDEERATLKTSLVAEGKCRDPLITWLEENILLDGHTRLSICKEFGLSYELRKMSFPNREAAKDFALKNQLERRSLPPKARKYYLGVRLRTAMERWGEGDNVRKEEADRLAKDCGLDPKTIERNFEMAWSIDEIATKCGPECGPEFRQKLLAGEVKVADDELKRLAMLPVGALKPEVNKLLAAAKPNAVKKEKPTPQQRFLTAWTKLKEDQPCEVALGLMKDPKFAEILAALQRESNMDSQRGADSTPEHDTEPEDVEKPDEPEPV